MKLNPNFLTHTTKGENYIISTGDTKFKGIVKHNSTVAFIVDCLKQDTTEEAVVEKVLEYYIVDDKEIVIRDVSEVIRKLRSIGAIEE